MSVHRASEAPPVRTRRLGVGLPDEDASSDVSPGALVDRYLVVGRLGRGGMGEVFRAYDPVLRREVALKVVRLVEPSSEGQARLLREARALARLSHPNVVTVYDVGTIGDEVFVAMELVEGSTLRVWLDSPRTPDAVVDVFVAAAEGLAAAHDAGLVHRDFKPDNVMLGDDGRVRVLDFGLAREHAAASRAASGVLDGGDEAEGSLTHTSAIVGTPRYMAPEQWRGERADARSDQFAFAVALCEALYGEHPFGGRTDGTSECSPVERLPIFRTSRVAQDVRDALVKALAREPSDRHESLRDLALALRPKPARASRRTRALVVAGALLFVAVSLLGVRASRVSPCGSGAEGLAGVWDDARKSRVDAVFVESGLEDGAELANRLRGRVDAYAASWAAMQGEACRSTRELGVQSERLMDLRMHCLMRLRDRLRGFLDGIESTRMTRDRRALLASVGDIATLPPVAVCADVDALSRAVPLPDDPAARAEVLDIERRFDELSAQAFASPGAERIAFAKELAARAEAIQHAPTQAEVSLLVGLSQLAAGKAADAATSFEASILAAAQGRDDRTEARAWAGLIEAYGKQSLYEKVLVLEPAARAAIARHADVSDADGRLDTVMGWALRELGRFDEARARYESALKKLEGASGRERDIVTAESGLGVVAKEQGRYEEARAHYERAIALSTAALGARHPTTLRTINNLAVTLKYLGRYAEARELYERVRDAYASFLDADHPDHGIPLANLGNMYRAEGRLADAKASFMAAMRVWEKAYGPRHLPLAHLSADIASALVSEGAYEEALASYARALVIAHSAVGADSWHTARIHAGLATSSLRLGHMDRALAESARALEVYRASGTEPSALVELEIVRADVLWAAARRAESTTLVRAARARLAGDDSSSSELRATLDGWLETHIGDGPTRE